MVSRFSPSPDPVPTPELLAEVRALSRPLRTDADLDPLVARLSRARVALLGEASHGTHEYYTWRTRITRRLVEEHGFSFIAVEGDWPDCYRINRFVKQRPGAPKEPAEALETFRRWPTWMWANAEVEELVGWLRDRNAGRPDADRVGFYGLDVYSLWDSLYQVVGYLQRHHPEAIPAAHRALQCFEPFGEDAQEYARATRFVPHSCEDDVVRLLHAVRTRPQREKDREEDSFDGAFVAEQNALVVKNAEAYYRTMVRSDESSWNVRDRHMAETLDRLLRHHGPRARGIVWEHNTHVGDARHTDMADGGEVNIGQLAREAYGEENVAIAGFGSYQGSVIAGRHWDAEWERMPVPPARPDSWEAVLHAAGADDKLLLFERPSAALLDWRGHRAIGVVYRPDRERLGNYVPTRLPRRYDAFLFLDRTTALEPLPVRVAVDEDLPETYPSGV